MELLKKNTFKNSVFAKVLWVIIIAIAISFIGYMFGKFTWYVSH